MGPWGDGTWWTEAGLSGRVVSVFSWKPWLLHSCFTYPSMMMLCTAVIFKEWSTNDKRVPNWREVWWSLSFSHAPQTKTVDPWEPLFSACFPHVGTQASLGTSSQPEIARQQDQYRVKAIERKVDRHMASWRHYGGLDSSDHHHWGQRDECLECHG